MTNFRTYDLAVDFYQQALHAKLPGYLKNQLLRAASSVALNLREGRGRSTLPDQLRFFHFSLGSLREVQAVLDLHPNCLAQKQIKILDQLGASLYLLIKNAKPRTPITQQPASQ
jgi:four helix bundle protein